jgi:predicted O-methyltransferase YrrM
MSKNATYLNDELYAYVLENFSCDDEELELLKAKAKEEGLPEIYITPDQGKFMQVWLKSMKAKNILEIGTLAGYSAIVMARALPEDGKIITIDKNEKFANFAKKMISELGYDDKIEVINCNARAWVREHNFEEHFDFAFVDADKPGYRIYLDEVTPMLKKGGMFVADNAFAFGFLLDTAPERNPNRVRSMLGFNDYFNKDERYDVAMIPIGDGMIAGVKK